MNHTMCPHCGWNFETDKPVARGAWRLTPLSAEHQGVAINLTKSQTGILYVIAKADGEPVSIDALLNRVSTVEDRNVIAVHVSRLRRKLGDAFPLRTVRGQGLAWEVRHDPGTV